MTESEFATRSPDSLYCCREKRHVYYFQLSILVLHFPLSLPDNDELSLLREGGGRRKLVGWCEGRMVWQPQNWKLREWGWLGQLKSLDLWLVKMWQDLRSQNRRQWVHCSVGLRPKCSSSPFVSLASWPPLDGVVLIPVPTAYGEKMGKSLQHGSRLGLTQACVAFSLVSLTSGTVCLRLSTLKLLVVRMFYFH